MNEREQNIEEGESERVTANFTLEAWQSGSSGRKLYVQLAWRE